MKNKIAVITAVFVLAIIGLALAQMSDKGKEMMGDKTAMMEEDKGGMGMMGDKGMMGMMGGKKMMMHGMMMKMMEKTAVATSDGGIVVVSANKLTKFDKNLNLVKEVELKNSMADMHQMMQDCLMMKDIMDDDVPDAFKAAEVF